MLQGLTTKQRLYIMAMYQMDLIFTQRWKIRASYPVQAIALAAGEGNPKNGYNVMTGLRKVSAIKRYKIAGRVHYGLTDEAFKALHDMVTQASIGSVALTDDMFKGAL